MQAHVGRPSVRGVSRVVRTRIPATTTCATAAPTSRPAAPYLPPWHCFTSHDDHARSRSLPIWSVVCSPLWWTHCSSPCRKSFWTCSSTRYVFWRSPSNCNHVDTWEMLLEYPVFRPLQQPRQPQRLCPYKQMSPLAHATLPTHIKCMHLTQHLHAISSPAWKRRLPLMVKLLMLYRRFNGALV